MNSQKSPVKKPASEPAPTLDLRQEEDFTLRYANHIAVTQTGFDVKVTFGRMDPTVGPNVVIQTSAVTLPWPAVKTLIYLLRMALLTHEEVNGHVSYPQGGLTPPVRTVPENVVKEFPKAKEIHEKVLRLWDEFLAANPEARSEK